VDLAVVPIPRVYSCSRLVEGSKKQMKTHLSHSNMRRTIQHAGKSQQTGSPHLLTAVADGVVIAANVLGVSIDFFGQ